MMHTGSNESYMGALSTSRGWYLPGLLELIPHRHSGTTQLSCATCCCGEGGLLSSRALVLERYWLLSLVLAHAFVDYLELFTGPTRFPSALNCTQFKVHRYTRVLNSHLD